MSVLLFCLAALAFVEIDLLYGGTRLVFSLPCYGILALAAVLSVAQRVRGRISQRTLMCLAASAVFFGYVLIRTLNSPVEYLLRRDLYMLLAALIVYLIVSLKITSAKLRSAWVAFLLAMAATHCVVGIIQFAKGGDFMPFSFLDRYGHGNRASGFYLCPDHLAGYLEIVLFIGLSFTCFSRWKVWAKILAGYLSLVCLAGIVMTGSRGGYVSTFTGLVVFVMLSVIVVDKQHRDRLLYILVTIVAVCVLGGFGVSRAVKGSFLLQSRLQNMWQDDVRSGFRHAALEQFKLNPVVGTGSGTYLYYGRQFRARGENRDPVYAHNDYLHLLAEYGLIGMAGFAVFLGVHLRQGWKSFVELTNSHIYSPMSGGNALALTIGALSSIATYMVHSYVDFNLHIPANALTMAFVFGLLANPGNELNENRTVDIKFVPLRYVSFVLPGLGLWLMISGLPTLQSEYYYEKSNVALKEFNPATEDFYNEDAERFARAALRTETRNPNIYRNLGDALKGRARTTNDPCERTRFYSEALEAYENGLKFFPQDVWLVVCRAQALDALKRFDEADAAFRQAIAQDPNSGQIRCLYGFHFHALGKLDEAEVYYKQAFEMSVSIAAERGLQRIADERRELLKAKDVAPSKP